MKWCWRWRETRSCSWGSAAWGRTGCQWATGGDKLPPAGEKAEGETLADQLKVDPPPPPPVPVEGYVSAISHTCYFCLRCWTRHYDQLWAATTIDFEPPLRSTWIEENNSTSCCIGDQLDWNGFPWRKAFYKALLCIFCHLCWLLKWWHVPPVKNAW